MLWVVTFLSPELAIRRYAFLHMHFIECLTADVAKNGREDRQYGILYDVDGYTDRATGDELGVFYLKQAGPFWYVSYVGSGP